MTNANTAIPTKCRRPPRVETFYTSQRPCIVESERPGYGSYVGDYVLLLRSYRLRPAAIGLLLAAVKLQRISTPPRASRMAARGTAWPWMISVRQRVSQSLSCKIASDCVQSLDRRVPSVPLSGSNWLPPVCHDLSTPVDFPEARRPKSWKPWKPSHSKSAFCSREYLHISSTVIPLRIVV